MTEAKGKCIECDTLITVVGDTPVQCECGSCYTLITEKCIWCPLCQSKLVGFKKPYPDKKARGDVIQCRHQVIVCLDCRYEYKMSSKVSYAYGHCGHKALLFGGQCSVCDHQFTFGEYELLYHKKLVVSSTLEEPFVTQFKKEIKELQLEDKSKSESESDLIMDNGAYLNFEWVEQNTKKSER